MCLHPAAAAQSLFSYYNICFRLLSIGVGVSFLKFSFILSLFLTDYTHECIHSWQTEYSMSQFFILRRNDAYAFYFFLLTISFGCIMIILSIVYLWRVHIAHSGSFCRIFHTLAEDAATFMYVLCLLISEREDITWNGKCGLFHGGTSCTGSSSLIISATGRQRTGSSAMSSSMTGRRFYSFITH